MRLRSPRLLPQASTRGHCDQGFGGKGGEEEFELCQGEAKEMLLSFLASECEGAVVPDSAQ